jgi:hypothetical protein
MPTPSSPSKSPDTPDLEQQPALKTEWEELAELADMVGYAAEPAPGQTKSRAASSQSKEASDKSPDGNADVPLLDEDDLEPSESESKTKTPVWSNPMAKGGFTLTLMAIGFGAVGLIIASFSMGHKNPIQTNLVVAKPSPSVDPAQSEIGRLKTVNALGSQAQTLKQNPKAAPTAPAAKPAKSVPAVQPSPAIEPRSEVPIADPPSPIYSPGVTTIAPPPAPLPMAASSPPPAAASREVDPTQAWQEAAKLGSFGEGKGSAIVNAPAQPDEPTTAASTTSPGNAIAQPMTDSRYEADAAALLSGIPRQTVTITPGTTATATLTTPVVWAQDLKPDQQPQRFGLQLTQPLYAADGSVALPAGTQMVAKADAISDSGLVQLSVVAVVTPTAQGSQVIDLTPGALLITGEAGKPLMAENHNPEKGRIAGMDLNVALMGALGQVGTLLNRPANQTTVTSPYLSSTSLSNGGTNIVGGLLQGAFDPLMKRMQDRQKQEMEQILKRPNLWYIPAGRELQIFTNSQFEVSR